MVIGRSFEDIAKESLASQGHKELEWLLKKLAQIEPKHILEIGVHRGYSMDVWRQAFMPETLIGIEYDTHAVDTREFVIPANSHDHQTVILIMNYINITKKLLDFLFIDGDHTYEGVKKDFYMYRPLVRDGGAIVFDDMDIFNNPTVEVHKFWAEIKDVYKTESFHDDSNGLGIVWL